MARGDDRPDRDLDVLVALKPPSDRPLLGLRGFELEQTLSERLGRPVELVTEEPPQPTWCCMKNETS